ncbi:hypothetical protein BS47DRAFT_1304963, partial [Hydnum rufescens UP504]
AGGAQYEASATGAWDIYNQLDRPTRIVFPRNSSDVVSAMRTIFHSDEHYAVRGGGHSVMPGWNTIDNGVLIDFSQMKAFSYDPVRNSIFIEPGVLLEEVYDGLQSQGVAPVGGRVVTVGFSGLALGGGLSFLSPSQGWACDRFRSLDVVLTNGRLVTATHTNEYSDLFTALKGGGSRFGIVTRYEVDAIYVSTLHEHYLITILCPVIATTVTYSNVSGTFTTVATVALFYNGTEAQFKQVFADFLAIPAVATNLGPLSYNEVTKVPSQAQAPGIGPRATNYGGSTLYPGQGLFEKSYNNWLNFSTSFKDEVSTASLVITPVFQSQIDISHAHGGTSFTPPNGQLTFFFFFSFGFPLQPAPFPLHAVGSYIHDRLYFSRIPRSPGLPLYLNESEDVQDALTTYSGYEKLKEIYRKYDPTRFNVRRMVGPNGL